MAIEFCKEVSSYFISWLKKDELNLCFPFVCGLASEILYSYIEAYFPDEKVVFVKGHHKNDFVGNHCWLELENRENKYIIDPTYYQYYNDTEQKDILISEYDIVKNVYNPIEINDLYIRVYLFKTLSKNFKLYLKNIEKTKNKNLVEAINSWKKIN